MSALSPDFTGVILIGEDDDPHVESVLVEVRRRGVDCLVVDERRARLRLSYDRQGVVVEARMDGAWTRLDLARSVWWWRKETTLAYSRSDDFAGDFVLRERRELLEALEMLLPRAHWPLPPSAVHRASLKCHQLALAQQVGLPVPPTVVTNDVTGLTEYVARHEEAFADGRVLYKALTWYAAPPDRFLFSTLVPLAAVAEAASSVAAAPCQFQDYVVKDHELRVTIVGERCFPVRVESQAREETRVDYRRSQHLVSYSATTLLPEVHDRLLRLLDACGLRYGAFDLIATPDRRLVFLELNPMGQWLWLQQHTSQDISGAVADLLVVARRAPP